MKIVKGKLDGIYEIYFDSDKNSHEYFIKTYDEKLFAEYNISNAWVQENHSFNIKKNILRGLHFLLPPYTDTKLIRCIKGKVYDVFVDLRNDSPTKGKWDCAYLSKDDNKYLYIEKGFAHGYLTLEDNTEILYKHDNFYHKDYDCGIIWNDEILKINWVTDNPVLSEKDSKLMTYKEFINKFGGLL